MTNHQPLPPPLDQTPGVLRHLARLTRYLPLEDGDQPVAYVRVYARLRVPDTAPAISEAPLDIYPANDQGYEGIACVDDVARAATLALDVYELTRSAAALRLARDWLRFVVYMHGPSDHRLLNFILDEEGARHADGATSYPGGEPWTVRALRSFAMAWRVLGDESFLDRFWQTNFPATGNLKYTSLYALAVMDVYETRPDRGLRQWIVDMCEQMIAAGPGYLRDGCGQDEVELYGYYQLAALARAGRLLSEPRYIEAGRETVRRLAEPVVAGGFYHTYPTDRDAQSVFDVSPLALGLEEMYRATSEPRYRELALRCATWLDGANPAGRAVYDPSVGRCNDKVFLSGDVDAKTGAESAIEAGVLHLVRRRLEDSPGGADTEQDTKQGAVTGGVRVGAAVGHDERIA